MERLSLVNPFGAPVYYLPTLSSTMDVSRELARAGESHGTVISADFQEAGRGSRGRSWQADRGRNLFFTILLRYPGFSAIPRGITLRTGLAVSLAIEDFVPPLAGSVRVKWPNDVMILSPAAAPPGKTDTAGKPGAAGKVEAAGKAEATGKVAGILSEGDGKTVFIGIGVNMAQTEFPEAYRFKATSIALALSARGAIPPNRPPGEEIFPAADRFRLLEAILARLFEEFSAPGDASRAESWRRRLEERLYMRGCPVRFFPRSGSFGGTGGDTVGETVGGTEGDTGMAPCVFGGAALAGEAAGGAVEGRLEGIGPNGEILILPEGFREPRSFVSGELDVYLIGK
jgi:BirA family biotin operon repressor/biotin-[acetyl-CoA-carboxylase] ligase